MDVQGSGPSPLPPPQSLLAKEGAAGLPQVSNLPPRNSSQPGVGPKLVPLPPHSPPWASAPDLYGLGSAWDRPGAREPLRESGSAAMRGGGGKGGKQRCVLKSASFWPRLNFQEAGFD